MGISTRTWDKAGGLLSSALLEDSIDLYIPGELTTVGFVTTRELDLVDTNLPALVQTTTLANAAESLVEHTYSIKVLRGTAIEAGMVVQVAECVLEPSLVGRKLLVDKVSENGLALLRKAVATDWTNVDQQGKGDM